MHMKKINHTNEQVAMAIEGLHGFMSVKYTIKHVPKLEQAPGVVLDFVRSIGNMHGCNPGDMFVVILACMNTPYSKSHSRVADLARAIDCIIQADPKQRIAIVTLPDESKRSSDLGLQEEHSNFQNAFNERKLWVDTRIALPFTPQDRASCIKQLDTFSFRVLSVRKFRANVVAWGAWLLASWWVQRGGSQDASKTPRLGEG
jgi:hypothetical protein